MCARTGSPLIDRAGERRRRSRAARRRIDAPPDRRKRRDLQRLCRSLRDATAPGCSILCRSCSTADEWREIELGVAQRARLVRRLARRICTERSACWRTARYRRSCRSDIRIFSGHATASRRPAAIGCTSTPSISRARRTAAGGRSPIGRKLRRDLAMPWKIGRSCRACFPDLLGDLGVRSLGGFFGRVARESAAARARGRSAAGGGADPGIVQRNLFRACLSRAAIGPAAGGRP